MAATEDLDALRASISVQAEAVKQMKADGSVKEDIMAGVAVLKDLRARLKELSVDEVVSVV